MVVTRYFEKIKKNYDDYQLSLLRHGRLPVKDTGVGFWGATPLSELFTLFKNMGLYRYKSFLDLGSGDGRVVLTASLFDIESHGIEADEELVDTALEHRRKLALEHFNKTKFLHKNFMEHKLSGYDLVYVSPDKPFFRDNFENKILSELDGQLIVHGWEFHPQNMQKVDEHVYDGEKFTVYKK